MADFKQCFADEVRRLARKEIKLALEPILKALSGQRQSVSEVRKQLKETVKNMGTPAVAADAVEKVDAEDKKVSRRITGKRIIAMRKKMGLSQAQFAELLGVSLSSIVNWEKDKRAPRASQKEQIAKLRAMGKREMVKRLETAGMPLKSAGRKRKAGAEVQEEAVPAPVVETAEK